MYIIDENYLIKRILLIFVFIMKQDTFIRAVQGVLYQLIIVMDTL